MTLLRAITSSALLLLIGCAGPNKVARAAPRISFAEIARGQPGPEVEKLGQVPFVLHVKEGQEVPVDFALQSRLFALETGEWKLTAKRDFYVLFRADGPPLLSEDGVEFEQRPKNSFALGLSVKKDEPATVQLRLNVRPE